MKLSALGVADDGGAIILDQGTGCPLPIPPKTFLDESDASDFVAYLGTPAGDLQVIRAEAHRWPSTRKLPRCPVCNVGRCEPGEALCSTCTDEVEHGPCCDCLRCENDQAAIASGGGIAR